MPVTKKLFFLSSVCLVLLIVLINSNCHVRYSLRDVSIPDSIKTVKVNFIVNQARYINPQLSPALTEKLRQKISSQTKLTQTNGDADWEISGYVSDYSVSTAGISQQQATMNSLNVSVHITLLRRKENNKQEEYDVSHPFTFNASLTLQQAESQLSTQIIQNMTDEIFNHIFSKW